MSGQHTPGPWEHLGTDRVGPDYGVAIVGSNLGGLVGYALPWPTEIDSGNFERVEANARLIAAAPDLLEALEWALAEIEGRTRYTPNDIYEAMEQRENALEAAQAAIAKARGDAA